MPKEKYKISLSEDEKKHLKLIINKGSEKARVIKHANVLLLCDKGKSYKEIEESLDISHQSITTMKKRYCIEGLDSALYDKPRPGKPSVISGKQKTKITALACSETPGGKEKWSLRFLTNRIIELGIVETISHEEVRKILKSR